MPHTDREKEKAYQKQYRKKNKDKVNAYVRKYRKLGKRKPLKKVSKEEMRKRIFKKIGAEAIDVTERNEYKHNTWYT